MTKYKLSYLLILIILTYSCKENINPKPMGNLRLEYPEPSYSSINLIECPFDFDVSKLSKIEKRKENCWFSINYPSMKAKIHISYFPINNNFKDLVKESQKLVYEHTIRASAINAKSFMYNQKDIYGNLYKLSGESASNIQFYATDSIQNFISGNVYFQTRPNSDSLAPAIEYISKDVIRIIETLKWKNKTIK